MLARPRLSQYWPLLVLAGLWAAVIVVVDPRGEFPLNDDWAYAWSVKTLLQDGRFQLSDWDAVNLLPQTLWGWLFTVPGGFSFTALRGSTLIASLITLLALAGFFKLAVVKPTLVAGCLLTIAFNPLYVPLSFSFNSDIPSLALFACASYLIARGLSGSRSRLVLGALLSLIALLDRQTNFVLLPALGLAYLASVTLTPRSVILSAIPTVTGLALQTGYAQWLVSSGHRPLLYGLQANALIDSLSHPAAAVALYASNFIILATYVGLFLFPILVVVYSAHLKQLSSVRQAASLSGVVVCVVAGFVFLHGQRMPLVGNVLDPAGLGPQQVAGYYDALGTANQAFVRTIWNDFTALGLAGAAIFVTTMARVSMDVWRHRAQPDASRPLVVFAASTLLFLFLGIGGLPKTLWFDRYTLALLPVAAMLVLQSSARARAPAAGPIGLAVGVASFALLATFSVAATHDLLASTRTRWALYQDALTSGTAQVQEIDDWDFVGWHFAQRIEDCNPALGRPARATWDDFTCLRPTPSRPCVAAYQALEGHAIASSRSYQRWIPPMTDTVFFLRKPADASPAR